MSEDRIKLLESRFYSIDQKLAELEKKLDTRLIATIDDPRIEKLENHVHIGLGLKGSQNFDEIREIRTELSEQKESRDILLRHKVDAKEVWNLLNGEIAELKEQGTIRAKCIADHEGRVQDIKEVLREFNVKLLDKQIITIGEYVDNNRKLGGEKEENMKELGDRLFFDDSKPPSKCCIPKCEEIVTFVHKNGWNFCNTHKPNKKPPSCYKCNKEMQMDLHTLDKGDWYCPNCDHFSVKNPSEQDVPIQTLDDIADYYSKEVAEPDPFQYQYTKILVEKEDMIKLLGKECDRVEKNIIREKYLPEEK